MSLYCVISLQLMSSVNKSFVSGTHEHVGVEFLFLSLPYIYTSVLV